MKKLLRELLLLSFVFIPLVLLYIRWSSIPDTIPVHFDLSGKADRLDNKQILLWLLPVIQVLVYVILAFVPLIDPKRRVSHGHSGFYFMRLAVVLFVSIVFISYIFSLSGEWDFSKSIPLFIMAFITVMGNYLPIIKPNYFIGIRTPWALENDQVWKTTHQFCGRLWVVVGVLGFITNIIWPSLPLGLYVGVIILLVIVSVVYSYGIYKKLVPDK